MKEETKQELVKAVKSAAPVVAKNVKHLAQSMLTIAAKTLQFAAGQVVEALEKKK